MGPRRTITGLSASRVTLSAVDGPKSNRAQAPRSRETRMIRSASYLRATFRIAPTLAMATKVRWIAGLGGFLK